MPSRRIQRLNEQLRRELSEIVRWDVADPRVGPAMITRVETTSDLSHARVWIMSTGDEGDARETLAGLKGAASFIRGQLAGRIEIRKIPELEFRLDQSMRHVARIEELLDEVRPADEEVRERERAGDEEEPE